MDQLLQISPSYNPEKEKVEYGALKREFAEIREIKDKKENKPKMSETVANLSILCSSAFLQQINPTGTNSLLMSAVAPKKKLPNLGSSVFGMHGVWSTQPEDEIVTDIREVTLGITQGHSDSEGDEPATRKIMKEDETPGNESGFMLRKNISSASDYLFKGW